MSVNRQRPDLQNQPMCSVCHQYVNIDPGCQCPKGKKNNGKKPQDNNESSERGAKAGKNDAEAGQKNTHAETLAEQEDLHAEAGKQDSLGQWLQGPNGQLKYRGRHLSLVLQQDGRILNIQGDFHLSGIEEAFKKFTKDNSLVKGKDFEVHEGFNFIEIRLYKQDHYEGFLDSLRANNSQLSGELRTAFQTLPRLNNLPQLKMGGSRKKDLEEEENQRQQANPRLLNPLSMDPSDKLRGN